MKLTRYRDLQWQQRPDTGKKDGRSADEKTRYKLLQSGVRGATGHFEMVITTYPAVKKMIRHRHAHDQLRFSLRGASPWAPGFETPEGSLLYIPAGTAYGPYDRPTGIELVSLEFEAREDAPFADSDMIAEGHRRLLERGYVDGAVFHWVDDDGKPRKMQLVRAQQEEATGQPFVLPPARFTLPIEFHPDAVAGQPLSEGVSVREMMGGQRGTRFFIVDIEFGAALRQRADQRLIGYVLDGNGSIDGREIESRDSYYLEIGESVELSAPDRLAVLCIGLPRLGSRHPIGEVLEASTHVA